MVYLIVYFIIAPMVGVQTQVKDRILNDDFRGKQVVLVHKNTLSYFTFAPLASCQTMLSKYAYILNIHPTYIVCKWRTDVNLDLIINVIIFLSLFYCV